jgi:hypothetical protein
MAESDKQKSELEDILIKNASGIITRDEYDRAVDLIYHSDVGERYCLLCELTTPVDMGKAIVDTPYCRGHAMYLLITGK